MNSKFTHRGDDMSRLNWPVLVVIALLGVGCGEDVDPNAPIMCPPFSTSAKYDKNIIPLAQCVFREYCHSNIPIQYSGLFHGTCSDCNAGLRRKKKEDSRQIPNNSI